MRHARENQVAVRRRTDPPATPTPPSTHSPNVERRTRGRNRPPLIHQTIDERGLTRKEAASLFGVAQSRIAALRHGEIGSFTSDELIEMLAHANMHLDVSVKTAA
jgi:hypothetical protein